MLKSTSDYGLSDSDQAYSDVSSDEEIGYNTIRPSRNSAAHKSLVRARDSVNPPGSLPGSRVSAAPITDLRRQKSLDPLYQDNLQK